MKSDAQSPSRSKRLVEHDEYIRFVAENTDLGTFVAVLEGDYA
jgi:hypothetical protein